MIHINDFVDKVYCINLKERKDRKQLITQEGKKWGLDITFFNAIKNKKGWIGCLQSHLKIIKQAKRNNYGKILIIEDDCEILDKMEIDINELPKDWKQLYLGCNLTELLEENQFEAKNKKWVKMRSYTTHCMIINSTAYDEIIELIKECKKPVDVYYNNEYHLNGQCYAMNPMIVTQREDYSDIEGKFIKYNLKDIDDVIEIPDAPYEYNEKTNDFKLKLDNVTDDDLPYVSILTPTKNRKQLFPLAIHCFENLDYPKEKIEWVIVDDSNDGTSLKDILPKDKRIKYIKINTKKRIPISMKRNLCVKYAKHDILVNMDDDDYYLPSSLLTRVKVLLKYPKINMVGTGIFCCYEVHQNRFFTAGQKSTLAEATMTFRKSFWEQRKFNNKVKLAEGEDFLRNRKEECYKIPYNFILFVMNHRKNATEMSRKVKDRRNDVNFHRLPEHIMKILKKIHS